ncbi:hypothetical protein FBU59_000850 [Linderina macrospora]|uniref:Uncharacterized protein n=1 Tax=Linderina macrospora TaxID=4868 RepID=A0ACC1JFW6_9FUNG|nr:hypothetical protein FBU59_000850 [Linderina macrospora]
MAKSKQDKEKQQQIQEIEAQLRASANSASSLISSWLNDSDSDTDATPKAREIFKGRPARLGVGAKFLSHKEMLAAQSNSGILTADELKLKRKLTKGLVAEKPEDSQTLSKNAEKPADDDDDDESRSRMVGSGSKDKEVVPQVKAKKQKRSSAFLDSLVKRRKR